MSTNAGTGWRRLPKERIDGRDWLYKVHHPVGLPARPSMVDQRSYCGRVLDQGQTESCTGHAAASVDEQLRRLAGAEINTSPLFIYYWARAYEGWQGMDAGAYIFDAVKTLATFGSCPEKLHPFSIGVYAKPGLFAQSFARFIFLRKRQYLKITDQNMNGSFTDDVRDALARGYSVQGGIQIFAGFYNKIAGVVTDPFPNEKPIGGHAQHIVGYVDLSPDDYAAAQRGELGFNAILDRRSPVPTDQGFFIDKNSWGEGDGIQGYLMVSYSYVDKYGDDFWTMRDL